MTMIKIDKKQPKAKIVKKFPPKKVEETSTEIKRVDLKTLKYYFSQTGYFYFLIVLIFVGLMQFGRNFIELFLANWVKSDSKLSEAEKYDIQRKNTFLYLIFVILHSIATTGRSALFAIAGLKACSKIYDSFINKIINAKHKFFMANDIGKLANLLENDILTIDEWLPFEFNRLLAYSFGLAGSMFVIGYSSLVFLVIFVIIGVYYVNLFKNYNPASRFISNAMKDINEPFLNLIYDTLEGRIVVRALRQEGFFMRRFHNLLDKRIRTLHTEQYLGFWLSLRLDLLAFYIYSIAMVMIGVCVYRGQYEYITVLSLGLTYAMNITSPLSSFLPWITYTEEQFYSVERVLSKMSEIEDESPDTIEESPVVCNDNAVIVEFKDVFLKYNEASPNYNLINISFQVFNYQRIGIIGRTGAGKTTIFTSLLNLYQISKGDIFLYNKKITDYGRDRLRKHIIVVPKDYILFEGSLKENIDFDGRFSDLQVVEFLNVFKDELFKKEFEMFCDVNYKIEENGSNLSEGQKSLIQIFRGLIKNPSVLCLDESNADLDDETEKILFKIIFGNFTKMTFLVIAHKLNILENFDRILVVENGQIVDEGLPKAIMSKNYL